MSGMRMPTGLKGRQKQPQQDHFLSILYCAKGRIITVDQIADALGCEAGHVARVVYGTRQIIQGTGWTISNHYNRGYSLLWKNGRKAVEKSDIENLVIDTSNEIRRLRADIDMIMEALSIRQYTQDEDDRILATGGTTGKIIKIADDLKVSASAIVKRYKIINGE